MGICCGSQEKSRLISEIKADIYSIPIVVYSKAGCPKCLRVKSKLYSMRAEPKIIEVHNFHLKGVLKEVTGQKSFPFVFVKGEFVGSRKFEEILAKGSLDNFIKTSQEGYLRTLDSNIISEC